MLYALVLIIGIILGWLIQWLLDRRFWQQLQTGESAQLQAVRLQLDVAERQCDKVQQALDSALLDNSRLISRLDVAALHATEMERNAELLAQLREQPTKPAVVGLSEDNLQQISARIEAALQQHTPAAPAPEPVVKPEQVAMPFTAEPVAAVTPRQPRDMADLQVIKGIGPKIAEVLIGNGFPTFVELAAADAEAVSAVLLAAGGRFRLADTHTWPQQAQLILDENWQALADLQAQIV